ncbi:MAG: T9SS type A sorting domain-containing protein [Salinivirgaceae bacterium]|jgi:hypothetical protein|nr:T9SS type A sorting domain-containing protein [Salinivirgaceae bacterium]
MATYIFIINNHIMRIIIVISLLFSTWVINAQPLTPFISTSHGGSVTYMSMEFLNDTLWVSGGHHDGKAIVWKYDERGNVLDSIVFAEAERFMIYKLVPYGDSMVIIGTDYQTTGEGQLVMHCLDRNLNRRWTKATDYEFDPLIMGFSSFERFQRRFVVIQSGRTHLFKFDRQFNFIDKKYVSNQLWNEPVDFTNRGFLMVKHGGWIVEIDTSFNEVDTLHEGNGLVVLGGKLLKTRSNKYIGSSRNLDYTHRIIYLDSNYSILNSYPYFGSETPRYTVYKSLVANVDTTEIFSSGFLNMNQTPHPVDFASYEANSFWVAYLGSDSLIWHRFYEDNTYYYYTTNMTIGPDGALYISASRYNAIEQPSYSDAVIFKVNMDGDLLVGTSSAPQPEKTLTIYPNPGKNYLYVEMPETTESTLLLYNLQGKLVLSELFRKNCHVSTQSLIPGIYFYRVVNENGSVFTGKWIKK